MNYISFSPTQTFADTDIIDIIAFSNKVTKNSFGYKIFKDMLNKNSYSRIDDSSSTTLAKTLQYHDNTIELVDGSLLPEPSARLNKPGVIFIDGERIEYLRKEGNVIRQLKRGTLGTGVKNVHDEGSLVRDQSIIQTIPYKDEFITSVTVSDGYTNGASIYTNSTELTVASVVFLGEDQTADLTGSQTVTVTGTGFKINVKVFVGDVDCVVNRINENLLTFVTPAKSVGAYDLIIYNAPIVSPTTFTTAPVTGVVTSASLTTTITELVNASTVFRTGMILTKISGTGDIGAYAIITEINSETQITIKSTTVNTYGSIIFTGTEDVKTVTLSGTVNTADLVSTVTLTGSYVKNGLTIPNVTSGLQVGQIVSKVSGNGAFGSTAIITSINNLTTFTVTATSINTAGPLVFNINNQTPTSRVISGGVKYLKIPLDFALAMPTVDETWYRKTIPSAYNQCNDVEVFVAGRRLRKSSYTIWDPNAGPDSPSGDMQYEAEFAVTATNNQPLQIRLTEVPAAGQYIVVQKRVGRAWTTEGVGLADSGSDSAKFIRSTYALLPDKNKV